MNDQLLTCPTCGETGFINLKAHRCKAVAIRKTNDLAEPEALIPVRGGKCCTVQQQLSCQQVEDAIREQLDAVEFHRKASAIADLRAGVLFHLYKQLKGSDYTGFWTDCENTFAVNRATISRKMRLALQWAREAGADPDTILQLAQASNLEDTSIPAVQLAFDFIGDQTTTDLYRKYNLVKSPKTHHPIKPDLARRQAEDEDALANLSIETLIGNIKECRLESNLLHATDDQLRRMEKELITSLEHIRSFTRQSRA